MDMGFLLGVLTTFWNLILMMSAHSMKIPLELELSITKRQRQRNDYILLGHSPLMPTMVTAGSETWNLIQVPMWVSGIQLLELSLLLPRAQVWDASIPISIYVKWPPQKVQLQKGEFYAVWIVSQAERCYQICPHSSE